MDDGTTGNISWYDDDRKKVGGIRSYNSGMIYGSSHYSVASLRPTRSHKWHVSGSTNALVISHSADDSLVIGIGTAVPPKTLTVEGEISASGTIHGSELNLDVGTSDPPGDTPAEGTIRAVWSGGARSPVYKIFAYLNGGWRSTTLS